MSKVLLRHSSLTVATQSSYFSQSASRAASGIMDVKFLSLCLSPNPSAQRRVAATAFQITDELGGGVGGRVFVSPTKGVTADHKLLP